MIEGLGRPDVITLFVDDVPAAKAFYQAVIGLDVIYEDDSSAVVRLANLIVNLLAPTTPRRWSSRTRTGSGTRSRCLFTIEVPDVAAVCAELAEHGVPLLNGPTDRPWARRTAAFADPAGHVREVVQILAE